jgi:hypothetical protein
MNLTSVRRLRKLKIKEELHDSNPPLAPVIDQRNWPKMMEASQDCLGCILGETEVLLACVM